MGSIRGNRFDILRKPRITEKSAVVSSEGNVVVFDVHPKANKLQIKDAVEKIFSVKVASVRTANAMGKRKKIGIRAGGRGDFKKAYVSLAEGHSIDLIGGGV